MNQHLYFKNMVLQKEKINLKTKVNVWLRDCYHYCIYLCQCKTCESLVYIQKSVSDSLKLKEISLNSKHFIF